MHDRIEANFLWLLERYGKYLLYLRSDRHFRCSCWNADAQEADSHHADCLGTGWVLSPEKWIGHVQLAMPQGQQEYASPPTMLGQWPNIGMMIFLPREAFPVIGDYIAEVEWSVPRAQVPTRGHPVRLVDIYAIQAIERIAGRDGQIVSHKCACHTTQGNFQWAEEQLMARPSTTPSVAPTFPLAPSAGGN